MPKQCRYNEAEVIERIRAGESFHSIAKDVGVTRAAISKFAKRKGLKSAHGRYEPTRVVIRDELLSLHQVAKRYGFCFTTIFYRYHNGDRGEHLIREPIPSRQPHVYYLGYDGNFWKEAAEYGREVGARLAGQRLRVPMGAITAAMKGEEHRLE